MDTSLGEPSQDIRSLNEIRFSFIVLSYCYFSVMKRKQFISKFWVLHGDFQYKVSQARYLHVFSIGIYWKMDRKWNDFESWRRVYKGNIHITAMGFEEHCNFWKQTLEWIHEKFLLIHESKTHYERLFTTITEFFFGNGYFWNIFSVKTWGREVFSYLISELARLGKVKSHHFSERIKAKRQYFYFLHTFLEIFNWRRHWTTLLDTGWDSLLSTWIILAPE